MADVVHSSIETISLAEARALVVAGRVSAAALAEEHYERIAAVDPEIHSYLALTRERAMLQAEKIDAAVKAGDPVGALAGVPVGIKDVLTVKGVVTTAGSKILGGYRPPYEATVVGGVEVGGVAGGSAGGPGAAVAVGLCVASLGAETGGSIRQRAGFCGVVGGLPTYGHL